MSADLRYIRRLTEDIFSVFVIRRDVLPQNFDSYNNDVQKLICTADHLGALMQYDTAGFLPNRRIHRGDFFVLFLFLHVMWVDCSEFIYVLLFIFFLSHGFSNPGGDAGHASDMDQL